jgi:amino acid transporter
MPTTLTGLLLFVVLLLPGITYVVVRERSSPERRWSAFRETATVAAVSAVANIAALLLFAIVHQLLPNATPSLGSFIYLGSQYWRDEYSSIIGWGIGTLGLK